jgi:hypothetical protein
MQSAPLRLLVVVGTVAAVVAIVGAAVVAMVLAIVVGRVVVRTARFVVRFVVRFVAASAGIDDATNPTNTATTLKRRTNADFIASSLAQQTGNQADRVRGHVTRSWDGKQQGGPEGPPFALHIYADYQREYISDSCGGRLSSRPCRQALLGLPFLACQR